jgi:putative aminopeptidase FrvX
MRKASLKFLEELVNTPSPSGREARGQRVWLDYVTPYAEETSSDAYGNVVATLNKGGGPRLMIAAHADEIAMTINYIDSDGYIYVRRLGGIDAAITKAQRVTIHTRKGPVLGVVGNVAPHLMKIGGERKVPQISDIFIDIGVNSKKEAEKLVRIGDAITVNDQFEVLRDDKVVARAFDNRAGAFAVAETLRLLSPRKSDLKCEVCFVSNTMEEIGCL